MSTSYKALRRILLIILVSLTLGAALILLIGQNPLDAYLALFKGAFVGKLNLGNTIADISPLLLTSMAFAIGAKGGGFNVGVEGELFLGGITAAYIGIHWTFLPMPIQILACFLGAITVGALWAVIPGVLKAYLNVSDVCTTILLNYVALNICSYLVSGPMSAGLANSQSKPVADQVLLKKFLIPSNANIGILISVAIVIFLIWMYKKTTFGYKINTIGTNPNFGDYVGIDTKRTFVKMYMLTGILGGIAGCIEVLGVHGAYIDNFGANLGFNGMLAALIVKNNLALTPFMAVFLGVLKSGALGMQQSTGVPKSIVDTITAIFIIVATMETLFEFKKKFSNRILSMKKQNRSVCK